jgi:hypothetical protein
MGRYTKVLDAVGASTHRILSWPIGHNGTGGADTRKPDNALVQAFSAKQKICDLERANVQGCRRS